MSLLHRGQFLTQTLWLVSFTAIASQAWVAEAQNLPGQFEAIAGTPYGVASLLIPVGQIESTESLRIVVSDADGRVMFPAVDIYTSDPPEVRHPNTSDRPQTGDRPRIGGGALVNRIRTAIQNAREQIDPPESIRVQFLFRGSEPFQVEISGDFATSIDVKPVVGTDFQANGVATSKKLEGSLQLKGSMAYSPQFQVLLRSWWDGYVQQATKQIQQSDYPVIVESYLTHMLAHRYGFELPELFKKSQVAIKKQSDPLPTLALVAGVEHLRAEIFLESLRKFQPQEFKRVPTPGPPRWIDSPAPETPPQLEIEPISKMVPPECYYLRFSSFSNYLWFQQLSETRGGDLAQMAILRGFNYETNSRMERLLNTKTTAVAKLFGDSIIGDMAIIGQDLYLQEGPSLGVLFEAKNVALLKTSLTQDRIAATKQLSNIGCKLEKVEIGGVEVSLLSSPDNQVRSFMVDRGQYVFLTTSKRLVERFLEVHSGGQSLGDSRAFRFARLMMPVEHKYDIFVYLSSEFFRNLVSPQYQIELRRRLKAIAAIEIAEMASLTYAAETGIRPKVADIDRLIADGYLPPTFQSRVDGAQTLAYSGSWHDSLRGKRGSFLPIADVVITECSVEEAQQYRDQASFYATQWQQTDPLMVGVRRYARDTNDPVERLALEAYIAPLGREKYGWLSSLLAAPVRTEIRMPPDDVINGQVHMAGQSNSRSFSPDHVMFAGLKDMVPPIPGETKGLLAILRTLQTLPAYMGGWPRPGYLDRLPLGLGGGPPDAFGFSKLFIGVWRWQMGGFSVLSFDRSILENCAMHLRPVPAEDFAQARLKIGDLEKSRLSAWFNTYWFRRAAQTTRGNLMLLDSLQEQLKVPAEDALATAEKLIDAKLQCSLGGRYELDPAAPKEGIALWSTSAWPEKIMMMNGSNGKPSSTHFGFDSTKSLPPVEYKAPWLQWFRGANMHLTQLPERLIVVGTFDIEPIAASPKEASSDKPASEALPKMNLDLFNLPFQFFKGDKPKAESENANKDKKPTETRKSF
jgi:hypothetical protein